MIGKLKVEDLICATQGRSVALDEITVIFNKIENVMNLSAKL